MCDTNECAFNLENQLIFFSITSRTLWSEQFYYYYFVSTFTDFYNRVGVFRNSKFKICRHVYQKVNKTGCYTHKYPQISTIIHKYPQISTNIHKDPQISTKIHKDQFIFYACFLSSRPSLKRNSIFLATQLPNKNFDFFCAWYCDYGR